MNLRAVSIVLTGWALAAAPACGDTISFREGGQDGHVDVVFDVTDINRTNDNLGNHSSYSVGCSDPLYMLIGVKDLFTLLPLSSGNDVISATLTITAYQGDNDTVTVYRCLTNWLPKAGGQNEPNVTGQHAVLDAATTWAGGAFSTADYDAPGGVSITWDSSCYGDHYAYDVTAMVKAMYDTGQNYGFIAGAAGGTGVYPYTEDATISKRPVLEVEYTPGAGPTYTLTVNSGTGDGDYSLGTQVSIQADPAPSGFIFDRWIGDTDDILDLYAASTTLTMPAHDVTTTAAYADASDPTITSLSGTVASGASVTISGSNFASHADYGGDQDFLCNGWIDFEDGSLFGGNFSCTNTDVWQIMTTNTRTNSSYHGRKYYNGTRLGEVTVYTKPNTHEFYSTFWIMLDSSGNDAGKIWRIWSDIHSDNIYLATGTDNTMIRGGSESQRCDPPPSTQWSSPNSLGYNQWHRLEIWMDDNPSEFTVWMDGIYQWSHDNWVPCPWYSGTHTWAFGHMINDCTGGHNFDDAYFSNTRARVEVGNATTWSACTHREVQIPTAWSGSSIAVRMNAGSFSDLTHQYLYVVNRYGNVNQDGYPLSGLNYTLTVTNGTGSGQYEPAEVVPISADPPPSGKAFAMWIGDVAHVADTSEASTTVTMPAADISVTATYRFVYQLTVNSGTGDGEYPGTTVVEIDADPPSSGREFDEWVGDTQYVADVDLESTTVTMPSQKVEVTATYRDILRGDLNDDGFVGQTDLDIVLDQWGNSGGEITDPRADPNEDDFVGQTDLDIVLDDWGKSN